MFPFFGCPSTAQSSTSRTPKKSHGEKFFPCVCGSYSKISFSSTIYFYSPTTRGQVTFSRPSPGPSWSATCCPGGHSWPSHGCCPSPPSLRLALQLLRFTSNPAQYKTSLGPEAPEVFIMFWLPLITLPTSLAPDVCQVPQPKLLQYQRIFRIFNSQFNHLRNIQCFILVSFFFFFQRICKIFGTKAII